MRKEEAFMVLSSFAEVRMIELEKSRHVLIEQGIILMKVKDGAFFELEDAEKSHRAHLELSDGKPFCILLDTEEGFFNVSPDAKKKIASKEYALYMKASAFIVTSMAARMTGNFFIKFIRPAAPTHLFAKKEEALEWLRKYAAN